VNGCVVVLGSWRPGMPLCLAGERLCCCARVMTSWHASVSGWWMVVLLR